MPEFLLSRISSCFLFSSHTSNPTYVEPPYSEAVDLYTSSGFVLISFWSIRLVRVRVRNWSNTRCNRTVRMIINRNQICTTCSDIRAFHTSFYWGVSEWVSVFACCGLYSLPWTWLAPPINEDDSLGKSQFLQRKRNSQNKIEVREEKKGEKKEEIKRPSQPRAV